jgi:hypothetical protein
VPSSFNDLYILYCCLNKTTFSKKKRTQHQDRNTLLLERLCLQLVWTACDWLQRNMAGRHKQHISPTQCGMLFQEPIATKKDPHCFRRCHFVNRCSHGRVSMKGSVCVSSWGRSVATLPLSNHDVHTSTRHFLSRFGSFTNCQTVLSSLDWKKPYFRSMG